MLVFFTHCSWPLPSSVFQGSPEEEMGNTLKMSCNSPCDRDNVLTRTMHNFFFDLSLVVIIDLQDLTNHNISF